MNAKEIIINSMAAFIAVKTGERLGTSIIKKCFQNKLKKSGNLFFNKKTHERVTVVEVISGKLFKGPQVIYESGGKRFQISLDSFTDSFLIIEKED